MMMVFSEINELVNNFFKETKDSDIFHFLEWTQKKMDSDQYLVEQQTNIDREIEEDAKKGTIALIEFLSEAIQESSPFSEKNISAPIDLKDVVYFSTPEEAEEFSKALQGAVELFKTCEIVSVTYPDKTEKSST